MFFIAIQVDRKQNTLPVLVVLSVLAAAGWALSPAVSGNVGLSMAVLSIAMFGLMSSLPVFWNLPTAAYNGTAAAAVIAIVTSLGNVPGFFSPYIVSWIRETTQSMAAAMYLFSATAALATVLLLIYARVLKSAPEPTQVGIRSSLFTLFIRVLPSPRPRSALALNLSTDV
ncbi:hypothetical protein [Pseudomonas baltica]|uniref:hypothetical protein n=1 Tax=Pseudomonas baltica TaxID=2762576 RepID=UPI00289DE121|nr:hypothetical protein [Pseudomonas baltica]